jgi:hypothetical protein
MNSFSKIFYSETPASSHHPNPVFHREMNVMVQQQQLGNYNEIHNINKLSTT